MAAGRTSRSNLRVRWQSGTALSNVGPVRRRRRCCTRRRQVERRLSSQAVRLWVRHRDLVHGSVSSSRAICKVSISVVADDVAALVDFQHGLEFGVGYDVHGGLQRVAEMKFYAQVALLYQMEAGAVALVGGQVKTEEGVTVSVVVASQTVPLVLPNLTGRGEQAHDEEVVLEIGLEGFGGYLSSVHVHRVEAYGVVLGVKRILVVRTVVGIVIDAAQHQTFRQSAEEQVLVHVRPSTRGNGVYLAVDGPHRILYRALLESLDVCHLHGGIEGSLLDKQGGIDDVDPVIGVGSISLERKSSLIAHQSDLDIDAVDQEFILQKLVHV